MGGVFKDKKSHYIEVKKIVENQLGQETVVNVYHESGKGHAYIELKTTEDRNNLVKTKKIYLNENDYLQFHEYTSPRSSRATSPYEDGEVLDNSTATKRNRSYDFDDRQTRTKRCRERKYSPSPSENNPYLSNQLDDDGMKRTFFQNYHSSNYQPQKHSQQRQDRQDRQEQQQIAFIPFIVDPSNSMMYPQFPSMNFPIQQMAMPSFTKQNSHHRPCEKYSTRNRNKNGKP